ncbi:MAG: hypothetical protein DKM50_09695 [Candidatus Margulisiibacteriota bacterium]|nr:MAG: hypothetical protein A2X43_10155 [Candidatus Margulisbacteria bacterium GWD2_39_127]OGI01510.1 MAG: hypothetical protein A2X42_12015 [Candidatus Margulisbacteria bacterium GWF2_38_17]PZM78978.1 MAG: hypothetical protein DKM50_09695 [Candidatus Margulisiibacteriota bacterium]HAR64415.1 hypothetical protein [Candidatus Margulisiibacteriota bacterium]HCT83678.1 hypothetical protein [Candidatus Margulisiibacteriota bacterium]
MKTLLFFLVLLQISSATYAQGHDCGMMGYSGMGMAGMGLLSLLYFAIASFLFAVIFWLVYNWLVKDKKI